VISATRSVARRPVQPPEGVACGALVGFPTKRNGQVRPTTGPNCAVDAPVFALSVRSASLIDSRLAGITLSSGLLMLNVFKAATVGAVCLMSLAHRLRWPRSRKRTRHRRARSHLQPRQRGAHRRRGDRRPDRQERGGPRLAADPVPAPGQRRAHGLSQLVGRRRVRGHRTRRGSQEAVGADGPRRSCGMPGRVRPGARGRRAPLPRAGRVGIYRLPDPKEPSPSAAVRKTQDRRKRFRSTSPAWACRTGCTRK
jgi:hypothetical protein